MYIGYLLAIIFAVLSVIGVILLIVGKKVYSDILFYIGLFVFPICFVLCLISILLSFCELKDARVEYNNYIETKQLVESIYVEENVIENAGLNKKVIEMNQWLINARNNKNQYGFCSMYYELNLEDLDYIVFDK